MTGNETRHAFPTPLTEAGVPCMHLLMDNDYRERLRKALDTFSDNDLYELIECLSDEDKIDNLIAVQERIEELEEAICIAISELEETL